jgi:hypothetical protein
MTLFFTLQTYDFSSGDAIFLFTKHIMNLDESGKIDGVYALSSHRAYYFLLSKNFATIFCPANSSVFERLSQQYLILYFWGLKKLLRKDILLFFLLDT